MKTMESLGQKKFRPALTSSSFYQPPVPHSRMATLRPQSEYGMAGAPWMGYSRGSSSGSAEWPPWGGAGSRMGALPKKGRFCSMMLAAGAFLALVAVLAVAGLALYMGAFRNDNPDPTIVFEGKLKLRRGIGAGATTAAPAAAKLSAAIRQACSSTPLGPALNSADVLAISDDKLVAFFRLYLDRRKIPSTTINLEDTIRNILIENTMLKNSPLRQLNVDPTSISIRRDPEHAYRSESRIGSNVETNNAHPVQNAKEKILQTRMGVIRKPATQTNLTSHKVKSPASDEPDINFDELPVIQGSFQITKTDADITENKNNREHPKVTARPVYQKEVTTEKIKTSRPTSPSRKITVAVDVKNKTSTIVNKKTTTTGTTLAIVNKTESSTEKISESQTKGALPDNLPKLDTLFAVPTFIDQEPWRPIRPGEAFSTDDVIEPSDVAEDKMGDFELGEDSGVANVEQIFASDIHAINATNFHEKVNENPITYQGIWPSYTEYPPDKVYTSFTDPGFSSTHKEGPLIGLNYPKPYPIPVNKLSEEVIKTKNAGEVSFDTLYSNSQTNASVGNSSSVAPKDTLSTVAINVKPLVNEDNAEFVNLNGGVIIRKQNHTNNYHKPSSSENLHKPNEPPPNFVRVETSTSNSSFKEPVLYSPPSKWEYINGTATDLSILKKIPNKTFNETLQAVITENKELNEPSKNVRNSEEELNGSNITSLIDNLIAVLNETTTVINLINNSEEKEEDKKEYSVVAHGSSEPVDMKTQELLMKEMMNAQKSSSTLIPTLLPVKSNSGIGRPLRPRPKPPSSQDDDNGQDRSFPKTNKFPFFSEVKTFIQNLSPENDKKVALNNSKGGVETTTKLPTTSIKTDIVTSISYSSKSNSISDPAQYTILTSSPKYEPIKVNTEISHRRNQTRPREPTRKVDINEKFRLPKTHPSDIDEENGKPNLFLETAPTTTEFFLGHSSTPAATLTEKVKMLFRDLEMRPSNVDTAHFDLKSSSNNQNLVMGDQPQIDGDVLVKVHVETTMSSTLDNKDILSNQEVLELLRNMSVVSLSDKTRPLHNSTHSEISPEKLRHLAAIATITDSHNNTYFINENAPDEPVISTKAVSSNYAVNSAGFKILTKTYNKLPGNFKDDEKKLDKYINGGSFQNYENLQNKMDAESCEKKNLTVVCSNGQCLPETARCNRLLDCPHGEDEKGCTCADYLRSQFLIRKLCDGVLDCWDFSDENNCEWCTPDQYVCSNSRQCIDKDKICDGQRDCPQGDDEKQCVTVAMNQEDAKSYSYSKEGYIMVQKHGKWGRLCVQNFDKVVARSHSSLQIADLGRAVCKTMTYIDYEDVDKVIEDETNKEEQYFSLHYTSKGDSGRGGLAFRRSGCSRGQVAKVVCSQLQCGARPQAASQQARIVGGGNAGAGAWPWQAALYKEGDFQCGATLISDRWLISAGHCFYHAQEDYWVARLGALRRGTSFPSPYEQLQPISSIILHPGYIDTGFINDIALLKTAQRVAFSDYVRPICLPPHNNDMDDGRRCTVIGWGQLFEVGRIFPDTLQEVELPVISTSECRKRTIFLPLYRITDDMFCAGFDRGGRDACLGDSGGPLMCQEQDNQWYLYGVTSNGYGCARANRPGVYTKVTNYINWIQTTMQLYDDRSFDHPTNLYHRLKNGTHPDLDASESRSFHRHVDKCRGHRCPLGECLPPTRVCNGFMECSDGSDEENCR